MVCFKGVHFPKDIILMCVRWYVAYPLSTRHVEELRRNAACLSITPPSTVGW
jgi:transposase-like protein